jgi:predicted nucleic acid-binding protein
MRDLANDYIVLDISESLLSGAVALVRLYELRAYDAMQLAAAVALNQARIDAGLAEIILVSADLELNSAAQSERIVVEDPSDHP